MYSNYDVTAKKQNNKKKLNSQFIKTHFYFKTYASIVQKSCIHLLDDYKSRGNKVQLDMYSNYNFTANKRNIKKH